MFVVVSSNLLPNGVALSFQFNSFERTRATGGDVQRLVESLEEVKRKKKFSKGGDGKSTPFFRELLLTTTYYKWKSCL